MSPQKGKKRTGRPLGSKNKKPKLPAVDVDESAVMTLQEVADYLRCSLATVYRLAKRGDIRGFRLAGSAGKFRFLKSEIDKWIAKGGNRPATLMGVLRFYPKPFMRETIEM